MRAIFLLIFALFSTFSNKMKIMATSDTFFEFTGQQMLINVTYDPRIDIDQSYELGLRGNGLGLSWDSLQMLDASEDFKSWTRLIQYKSLLNTFCTDNDEKIEEKNEECLPENQDLQLEVVLKLEDGTELSMNNQLVTVKLPFSRSSSMFLNDDELYFLNTVQIFPYFFVQKGELAELRVTATGQDAETIADRHIELYLPPSLLENPQNNYKHMFMADLHPKATMVVNYKESFDSIFASKQTEQVVMVGLGEFRTMSDYDPAYTDRMKLLLPGEGLVFECKEGSISNNCNGCIKNNDFYYWMTEGGCGIARTIDGLADSTLDYLLTDVTSAVNDLLQEKHNTVLSNEQKERGILGFSFGANLACYAAWTRPETFGMAACSSYSKKWPLVWEPGTEMSNGEYLYKEIFLPTDPMEPRIRQKIVVDIGQLELNSLGGNDLATVMENNVNFESGINLWFEVYEGHQHDFKQYFQRMANIFKKLFGNP